MNKEIISPLSKEVKEKEENDMITRATYLESIFGDAVHICKDGEPHLDVTTMLLLLASFIRIENEHD